MPLDGLAPRPLVSPEAGPRPPAAPTPPAVALPALELPPIVVPTIDLSEFAQNWSMKYEVGELDLEALAPPPSYAAELDGVHFDRTQGLAGDCSVQAFFDLAEASAASLVGEVKRGLQAHTEPFSVAIPMAPGVEPKLVQVDPKVYEGLRAAPPEGPGLSPDLAFTMVCRLAVAQAINPGASISWQEDGQGQGTLVLQKSEGASGGAGLPGYAVRDFFKDLGIPTLLDLVGSGSLDAPAASDLPTGDTQFLAFLTDPATGTAHPAMVTRSLARGPNGEALYEYRVPGRGSISPEALAAEVKNFFMGTVAPNTGLKTPGPKGPPAKLGG